MRNAGTSCIYLDQQASYFMRQQTGNEKIDPIQKLQTLKLIPGIFVLVAGILLLMSFCHKPGKVPMTRVELSGTAQGTTWHIIYFTGNAVVTKVQVDSILSVIDSSLSIYKPYSSITAFNNSVDGIEIDDHFKK